jgi:hypothetical protein
MLSPVPHPPPPRPTTVGTSFTRNNIELLRTHHVPDSDGFILYTEGMLNIPPLVYSDDDMPPLLDGSDDDSDDDSDEGIVPHNPRGFGTDWEHVLRLRVLSRGIRALRVMSTHCPTVTSFAGTRQPTVTSFDGTRNRRLLQLIDTAHDGCYISSAL